MALSTFQRPFYTGPPVASLAPVKYPVEINGHGYVIEPAEYQRSFMASQRESVDQTTEPGEQNLNPEATWKRSVSDWSHGAGQRWLDALQSSDRARFRQSKGVDCWTPQELSMLHDASNVKKAGTGTTPVLYYDPANEVLWFSDGSALYRTQNPSVASPTWETATGLPAGVGVTSIANTGDRLYVTGTDLKLYRTSGDNRLVDSSSLDFEEFYTLLPLDGVAYANGRLLSWRTTQASATVNYFNAIVEISGATAPGTGTIVFQHPQDSFIWGQVIGTPSATLLCGHTGGDVEIYSIATTDATGDLDPPILRLSIPNESFDCAVLEANVLILSTFPASDEARLRLVEAGSSASDTHLTLGPIIFPDDAQRPDGRIRALTSTGRFVYFGWSNFDTVCTGAGRLDLSTFTSPLVPAYASDQMAGDSTTSVQGDVTAIAWDDSSESLYLAVSGKGVYGTSSTFMADNWLDTGRIRFGLLEPKVFTSFKLACDLVTGTTITITDERDDGRTETVVTYNTDGTGTGTLLSMDHTPAQWIELRIVFGASATPESPVLDTWSLYGFPVTEQVMKILVPVILNDTVFHDAGEQSVPLPFDVNAEVDFLEALAGSGSIFTYREGVRTYTAMVENVQPRATEGHPLQWNSVTSALEGLYFVTLKTIVG